MEILSLVSILIGLALLIYLVFKGIPLLVGAPLMAVLVLAISGINPVEGLLGVYSESFGGYMVKNWMLFLTSAIFGQVTGDSRAAKVIAYKTVKLIGKSTKNQMFFAVMMISFIIIILSIAGISGFVIIFTTLAIAKNIFEELNVPWHFFIAAIAFGAQGFVCSMLPGTVQIPNLMPMSYLGTEATAGATLGIIASILTIGLSLIYFKIECNKCIKKNEGFLPSGAGIAEYMPSVKQEDVDGSLLKALAPSIILLIFLNIVKVDPIVALTIGIIASLILFRQDYDNIWGTIGKGSKNAIGTLSGVAAIVGFGGVVKTLPGFEYIVSGLDSIPGPPIVQLVVATNLVAGITGSGTGGLGIALETFGERFVNMGINPQVIHRMVSISATGMDSMPYNSSIVNNINVAHLTHKYAYRHCFWLTLVIPVVVSFLMVIFVQMGIV